MGRGDATGSGAVHGSLSRNEGWDCVSRPGHAVTRRRWTTLTVRRHGSMRLPPAFASAPTSQFRPAAARRPPARFSIRDRCARSADAAEGSMLTTAPVATADATDAWPRHPGIAADRFGQHVFECARAAFVFEWCAATRPWILPRRATVRSRLRRASASRIAPRR